MFASLTDLVPLRGWNHSAEPLREALPEPPPTSFPERRTRPPLCISEMHKGANLLR